MPKMNGLDVLAALPKDGARPRVVVMTSDDTPETLLRAVREQAWRYVAKPVEPQALVELLHEVLAQKAVAPAIEVVSARPDWVELLVPCERATVDRIESFMTHLEGDLPVDVRESIGYAFRELLMNAIEWGGGLDPSRTVRVAFLRAQRMLLYRIADPGPGFNVEGLLHAAIGQPEDDPTAHAIVREEKGLRPGGFGILTVRAKVDELLYNEKRNEVVFVKYLD
jgi:anti-sigma regulatory factor (Ser/Thr protein kinase)